ncbi:MAG TPA: NADH-quinone oxidoreductase subunit NuoE [Caulobacterales bacterium]|nr:NADH-quinone oxidoreductase subunit NuoE [Caulobacterales bacterium]
MSTRRLAEQQPDSFAFSAESEKVAQFWEAKYPPDRKASAVIPLLWLAQKQEGWVSEPAIRYLAARLGMARIRVLEVATFYTMFHLAPVGKHHIAICGTTPCMLRGAEALKEVCKRRINAHSHAPSASGKLSWEEMECLGACVNAPMAAIDDYYHEDLTPESLEKLIDALERGEKIAPGSAIGRQTSAPEGGPQTLNDPRLYDGSLAEKIKLPNLPEKAQ